MQLSAESVKFLKQNWSKRPLDSLDRRLRELIEAMPKAVREHLDADPALQPLRNELKDEEDAATFEAPIRVLRNQLSHGTRNHEDDALQPWVAALETICRAHLLRLLEFPEPAVEGALQQAAA